MRPHAVIITTHRRPALLSRAIRSVRDQSIRDIQIVVVSDAACPETHGVASSLLRSGDVFVQRAGNSGPAESRNLGMRLAEAEYLAFLDDDDAYTPDFFRDVGPYLAPDRITYTDYHVVFETEVGAGSTPLSAERRAIGDRPIDDLHVKNFIPLHCLVYPKASVRDLRFDPALRLNEDWAFLLDVAGATAFQHAPIEGPIVYTRQRADNRGRSNDHLLVETYRTIYRSRPAPSERLKLARQAFLQANGVEADLDDL